MENKNFSLWDSNIQSESDESFRDKVNKTKGKRQVSNPDDSTTEEIIEIFKVGTKKKSKSYAPKVTRLKKKNSYKKIPKSKQKKRGRKKIWTDEKIAKLKADKKAAATLRRKEKQEKEQREKLLLKQPVTKSERKRIIEEALKTKKKIDKEIVEKRNQKLELNNVISFEPECNHLDKFSYMNEGYIVTHCKYCSREKKWDPREWEPYMRAHRKEM